MIRRIKWWLLKRKLFKINRLNGGDLDGDIVTYKGVKYYVNEFSGTVNKTSIPVPDFADFSHH